MLAYWSAGGPSSSSGVTNRTEGTMPLAVLFSPRIRMTPVSVIAVTARTDVDDGLLMRPVLIYPIVHLRPSLRSRLQCAAFAVAVQYSDAPVAVFIGPERTHYLTGLVVNGQIPAVAFRQTANSYKFRSLRIQRSRHPLRWNLCLTVDSVVQYSGANAATNRICPVVLACRALRDQDCQRRSHGNGIRQSAGATAAPKSEIETVMQTRPKRQRPA